MLVMRGTVKVTIPRDRITLKMPAPAPLARATGTVSPVVTRTASGAKIGLDVVTLYRCREKIRGILFQQKRSADSNCKVSSSKGVMRSKREEHRARCRKKKFPEDD